MPKMPHLLLAAGSSSRMGQPKALLPWGNQTLIESRIKTLQKTHQPIVLVLGSHSELILEYIPKELNVTVVIHDEWNQGMGSSIAKGVTEVIKSHPEAKALIISLLDQPLIPVSHYEFMVQQHQDHPEKIVVSQSEKGWFGVPVLFPSLYFHELQHLKGPESGKTLIKRYPQQLVSVNGNDYLQDMDSPDAYERLRKKVETNH